LPRRPQNSFHQRTNRTVQGMKFRKLRIAWSVGCGIICLLLIVLWVRSYTWLDSLFVAHSHNFVSENGRIYFDCGINWNKSVRICRYLPLQTEFTSSRGGQAYATLADGQEFAPYWAVVVFIAALGAASWLPWRFSLRTLLIATTLVALLLGAVV
jgi:hypothetical protein